MPRRSLETGPSTVDALDADVLLGRIPPEVARRVERLDVFGSLDSTNRYLLETPPPSSGAMHVAVADHQQAGRGRRGRRWSAPPGTGLCFSAALRFSRAPRDLSALPLAVGVAARRAAAAVCGVQAGLKWPNDLTWEDRKLGGILVEHGARSGDGAHVVIGIGLNVAVPPHVLPALCDWPRGAVDLCEASGGPPPARAALAAALIVELAELAGRFESAGFAAYRDEFASADTLRDRAVRIDDDGAKSSGIARGVDAHGALIVEASDGSRRRVVAGDVSIRGAGAASGAPR